MIMSNKDSYHTDFKYLDFDSVEKCLILSIFPDDLSLMPWKSYQKRTYPKFDKVMHKK